VLHVASLHLAANVTNLYILESVRRHYLDEYRGIETQMPLPMNGEFLLPPGPGLGVELVAEVMQRKDVTVDRVGLQG